MGRIFGKKKRLLVKCTFGYIPFRVNYYDGCSNGCIYCCGCLMCERFIHNFDYQKWLKPKLVKNALEIFEKNLASSRTKGEVFTQSLSDSYMDHADPDVTREMLELMKKYDFPILLLTKNVSVIRDLDFFKEYREKMRVGFTIVLPKTDRSIEPYSSPVEKRIQVLEEMYNEGIYTTVSLEPLIPNIDLDLVIDMIEAINPYVHDYVFVGKLTRGSIPNEFKAYTQWKTTEKGFHDSYYKELFSELLPKLKTYYIASHSRKFLLKHRIPFEECMHSGV
ncbi:MAG: hypothetical protein JSW72_01495 [Candidatus Bathyarchaeota archaeon]|nr:MAG: hypothetical protein JSW72_01495 [Candidatus Bathyarchaeota archaeon]